MCGISGFVHLGGSKAKTIEKMTSLIRHRGPDDEGFVLFGNCSSSPLVCGGDDTPDEVYTSGGLYAPSRLISEFSDAPVTLALGHRRLSIIDLSPTGHQPMCSPDGRYWIVYNGEIYNHIELRSELSSVGYRFCSQSDTEVILAAYHEWGAKCLDRFNGMWAFAIYDKHSNELFLARDRFGVKPLYYWRNEESFYFCSEIKQLLGVDDFVAQENAIYLRSYLLSGPREYLEETAFDGVARLLHGHYIRGRCEDFVTGRVKHVAWWSQPAGVKQGRYSRSAAEDYARLYAQHLEEAVAVRLRADVTVGSALSGGLDSSSIVSLVSRQSKIGKGAYRQETFSSIYPSEKTKYCDESAYIHRLAETLGIHANTIEPDAKDIPVQHSKMIWAMDTPPESTCMSGWHTFKLVQSRGVKVTLDGQGADEQLAGYVSYLRNWINDIGIFRAASQLPSMLLIHPTREVVKAYIAAGGAALTRTIGIGSQRIKAGETPMGLAAALSRDSVNSLVTLIHYSDRVSMAHSVESRMPFLDVRLVEFLASVPPQYKIHRGWTKMLARDAFDGVLPSYVVWRKDKKGWPIPEDYWFNGPLRQWFELQEAQGRKYCHAIGIYDGSASPIRADPINVRVRFANLHVWRSLFISSRGSSMLA